MVALAVGYFYSHAAPAASVYWTGAPAGLSRSRNRYGGCLLRGVAIKFSAGSVNRRKRIACVEKRGHRNEDNRFFYKPLVISPRGNRVLRQDQT